MAHTPAPWSWTRMNGGISIHAEGERIAWIANIDGTHKKYEDNACLMAAAPDLLEALEAVLEDYVAASIGDHDEVPTVVTQARAAIAKATQP